MTDAAGESQLLSSSHQRARQLWQTLEQHAAQLAADQTLDPGIREAGVEALRNAARCAARLVGQTANQDTPGPASFLSDDPFEKAQGDE